MKTEKYYSMLPDGMLVADIYLELVEVVECFERSACDAHMFLTALSELSERQWHTYELLHENLRGRIGELLMSLWDGRDLAFVEIIIRVAAQLGLQELFAFICSQKDDSLSPEVAYEIKCAISEFGTSISDPFSGMR